MNLSTLNTALGAALAGQVALAALTWWPRDTAATPPVPLLPFAQDAIARIEVSSAKPDGTAGDPVQLVKQGDGWVIENAGGYPADTEKVTPLLGNFSGAKLGDPIATQAVNHATLDVAADKFTRKVKVTDATGASVEFFLGAGTGSVANLRKVDGDAVWLVRGFTAWSIGDAAARYWNPSYLKVEPADLQTVTVATAAGTTLSLVHQDDVWSLADDPATPIDQRQTNTFVRRLTDLRLAAVAGKGAQPDYGLEGGTRVSWTASKDGQASSGSYVVGATHGANRYVKADGNDFVVEVAASAADKIANASMADLLPPPPGTAPQGMGGMPPGMGGMPPGMGGLPPGMGMPPGMR